MNGKGDKRRKKTVSQEVWDKNWELIFGKKEKVKNESGHQDSNQIKR